MSPTHARDVEAHVGRISLEDHFNADFGEGTVHFDPKAPVPVTTGNWIEDVVERLAPAVTAGIELFPKQQLAENLSYRTDELLFGGAAGPGKTEWGMEHVIRQMLAHPGNHGIIFRRVFPSLEKSVIPRMKAKLFGRATWHGGRHDFTFPNGSVLTLGHLQLKDSVTIYQGAEFGVVFFEELTEFLESQYTYMLHRLRAPDIKGGIHPHCIATTNPGGVGHAWVKRRFVTPQETSLPLDTETKKPIQIEVSVPWRPRPTIDNPKPLRRCFIPATMDDNPILMAEDPDYIHRIAAISDRGLREAMKTGDWEVIDQIQGAFWKQSWFDDYRVENVPVTAVRRVLALDPSDGTEAKDGDEFGVWVGCRGIDGHAYTEHTDGWRDSPAAMARKAINLARNMDCDAIVVEKNHGGPWIKTVLLSIDENANVVLVHASHGKLVRAEPVAALFDPERSADGVIRAHMVGHHEVLEGECTTYTGDPGSESPNRMDAMVWGHSELMFDDLTSEAHINIPSITGRTRRRGPGPEARTIRSARGRTAAVRRSTGAGRTRGGVSLKAEE